MFDGTEFFTLTPLAEKNKTVLDAIHAVGIIIHRTIDRNCGFMFSPESNEIISCSEPESSQEFIGYVRSKAGVDLDLLANNSPK